MAKSPEISEDFLHCKLCHGTFKDPRYLPCLHTFCKTCIDQNIRDMKIQNGNHYACPVCYKKVNLVQGKYNQEEIFPANILIADMTDAVLVLTSKDVKCQPCGRNGRTTQPTTWCRSCKDSLCDDCLNFHQSLKQTMKHSFLSIKDLKKKDLKEVMAIATCADHGEELTQFCEDHNSVICTVCTSSNHRTCRSVIGIRDAVQLFNKQVQTLQYKIQEQEKAASSVYNERQAVHSQTNMKMRNLVEEIKSIRTKIDTKLEKCESEILQELEEIRSSETKKMEENVKDAEQISKAASNTNDILKHSLMAGDAHLLQWLEVIDRETDEYSAELQSFAENKPQVPSINFAVNYQLDNILRTVRDLGELVSEKKSIHALPKHRTMSFDNSSRRRASYERRSSRDNDISIGSVVSRQSQRLPRSVASSMVNDRESEGRGMIYYKDINLPESKRQTSNVYSGRSPSDTTTCWLTGVTITSSGLIVCTDKCNKKIKVFDINFRLTSERLFNSEPFDVTTVVSSNTVAVTIPDEKQIEIFAIMQGLSPIRTIKISEKCYGISYTPGKFAVSCLYATSPSIKIISESGSEIQNINPDNGLRQLFMKPSYLVWDTNGTNLYISDSKRNHIVCMSGPRLKIFTYCDARLSSPRGVTLGEDDSIYVCGWATDNIHLVDRYGHFKTECLNRHDRIIGPQTVCFDKSTRRLVVTLDTTSCNSDNIFVFPL